MQVIKAKTHYIKVARRRASGLFLSVSSWPVLFHRSHSRLCALLRADALFCRTHRAAFLSDLFEAYAKAEEPLPEIKTSKQKGPFLRGPFCLLSVIKLYKKGLGLELVYVNPLTRGFDGLIRRLPYLTSIA